MKILRLFPFVFFTLLNCGDDGGSVSGTFKYLALGDSYTIGESVPATDNYPSQLARKIEGARPHTAVSTHIVATTGWTTSNLIAAISQDDAFHADYDLVTLLIGVNNQYQHKPFSVYQSEFPQLVSTAIAQAKGMASHVIVLSIPDYAYTPYGQGAGNAAQISAELQQYNVFAQQYCQAQGIAFINITDITQNGLSDPTLVAADGLHPSARAYGLFVQRLLPAALAVLN